MPRECDQLHPLLSLYLEEEVSAREKLKLARHLNECAAARRDLEFYRSQRRALLAFPEPEPPADLHERILNHVHGRDSVTGTPRIITAWWAKPRTWGLAAAALAAAFFLNLSSDWTRGIRSAQAPPAPSAEKSLSESKPAEQAPAPVLEAQAPAVSHEPSAPEPRAASAPAARREMARAAEKDEPRELKIARAPQPMRQVNPNIHSVSAGADAAAVAPDAALMTNSNAQSYSLDDANQRWSGNGGPYAQPYAEVIHDQTSFMAYWQVMAPGKPMPQVDFNQNDVAVIFLGSRPTTGYAIQIDGVQEGTDAVTLAWHELVPAPGTATLKSVTSPWAMGILPKTSKQVLFLKNP